MNTKILKNTVLGLSGLAFLTLATIGFFYKGIVRFNYPSSDTYPIQGIDVSHHQQEIDWEEVKKQNIQFAFIKATEGGDFKDKAFEENWRKALSVGIDVGAYHFFTFCRSGKAQGENFLETVPKYTSALPPVIDLEFGGNCSLRLHDKAVLAKIDTLQQLLEEAYQKKPILYITAEFYERFLVDQFLENPIWIRDIYHEPTMIDNRAWIFWQYANRGHLEGISTYVDLNVFKGNREAYERLKD